MNKLPKDKRDKLILISVAIVAVLSILYVFVLGAQKDKLTLLNAQVFSAKDKLGKAERLVKSSGTIETRLAERKQQLDLREKDMAPTGQYYYWFFQLLEEFRKKEGLASSFVVDISTQPELSELALLPKFPYRAATFTVHVNGRFQDLGRFLADFENNYPYFRVLNVQLSPENISSNPTFGSLGASQAPGPSEPHIGMQFKVVTLIKPSATT